MSGECYFCHGIVSVTEDGHIRLDRHGNHEVYMHERCGVGYDVVEAGRSSDGVEITCPECGTVETR